MTDTALIVGNNLSHNVSVRIEEAKTSLGHLANVYLVTEVAGQSQATVEAKRRDLQRFLTFYQNLYKHDRPDEWFVSVTKAFLKALCSRSGWRRPRWCASMPRCDTSPAGCIGSSLPFSRSAVPLMG